MKAILGLISAVLTVLAIVLTAKVMKPPAPIADSGVRPDPEPVAVQHEAAPAQASADVQGAEVDRIRRQNLFHPDRTWVDPATLVVTDAGTGDDAVEPPPEENDAENFELIGLFRLEDRATAAIKILPPKPKPAARSRSVVPVRRVPTPASPSGPAEATTEIYDLGDDIGETGYKLSKVEAKSVELTHGGSGEVILLELDRLDEGSSNRRKTGQAAAEKRLQANAAKVAAATAAAAAAHAAAVRQTEGQSNPAAPRQAVAAPNQPPPSPGVNAAAPPPTAEDRAKRLEEIREQFRKRLEARRAEQQGGNR